ncbi:DUF167 domain-containing protein [Legionella micdadei]|uniref:DUF167 domain-containing protein n=1 Tax=Legionella micdadei TaxID=451 RepID=UPI0009EF7B80|nr:DUF167 domain-containing protein [Legionella micdadei]ARG99805.1 YggU family protein [Legionella micdadei]
MWYKREADVITLCVYVQPGAKTTGIVGLHGDALKIRLNTQPIEGRANEALLSYIAQLFDVPTRQVKLVRGNKARQKILTITGSSVNPEFFSPKLG